MSNLELCAIFSAAACHDYEHGGLNNVFLNNTGHEWSILYNDKSPLENHHVSESFQILFQEQYNWVTNFQDEQIKRMREIMISIILSTDNAKHFEDLGKLKGRLGAPDFDMKKKDKQICMDAIVHTSDISNPIKEWDLVYEWTGRVLNEFWN